MSPRKVAVVVFVLCGAFVPSTVESQYSNVTSGASLTASLTPCADAFVNSLDAGTVFGARPYLWVGDHHDPRPSPTPEGRAYLKFHLGVVPAHATVVSATLHLYCDRSPAVVPAVTDLDVHYLDDDTWQESAITWDNAPTRYDAAPAVHGPVGHAGTWCAFNVVLPVRTAVDGDGVLSLVLMPCAGGSPERDVRRFASREAAANRPYLDVTYAQGPQSGAVPLP